MTASQRQSGGDHYRGMAIQPALFNYRNGLNALAANIVKYAARAGKKGGREGMEADLRKIIHYAELWLEYEGFSDAPVSPLPVCARPDPDSPDACGLYVDRPVACPSCDEG